jgi:hypothetical protein
MKRQPSPVQGRTGLSSHWFYLVMVDRTRQEVL